ncbi:hypothetical protein CANTEDRAFT_132607 [Yamadazyma tenuis ATCC 10573]|uniref:Uncharacterized protein n=1 Tax=Candida tenuis (strain ATCC 10573 / BCRC 21748 / CBS 615 / JCM 9827 / NBRC 10315 / NRRL Y-1498 / VKM Y-70) TaxID=590646 RepID=G3AXD6_CANTC|nr:uncharacterized protein CANTEDRAFT_132607 [Yamadazyma tenuis ATCC 10573]EGV66345.1 hypothetical protein CANTEDRAFT_132607 [Yamadazyma tenuis ATCC 10573]
MSLLPSSSSSFQTATSNLSYSPRNSLDPRRSGERLLYKTHSSLPPADESSANASTPIRDHKRSVSNPFEVLYRGNDSSYPSQDPKSFLTPQQNSNPQFQKQTPINLYTPKNVYTPEHIISPTNGVRRPITDIPPVITMIDQEELKRSNSVISREASLRNRFNIARRNKMINKKSLDINGSTFDSDSIYDSENKKYPQKKKPWNRKIQFMFPVKRRTSLKQKSAYQLLRSYRAKRANFQTKEELEQFLNQTNASKLMKELLPTQMKLFNYSNAGLLTRKPLLDKKTRYFNINNNNVFTIVPPSIRRANHSLPFQDYRKSGISNQSDHKEFSLVDAIYNQYRSRVHAGQYNIPPKFSEFFPEELDKNIISASDIDHMNRKALFEVLLRRTLAAKIEYRLQQNREMESTEYQKKESSSSDGSSSKSSDDDNDHIRHSHVPKLVHTDSEDSPDDSSINTDDLMEQNASLFSGLLPSPQISYKSNIFGSDFKLQSIEDFDDDDMSSKARRHDNKSRRTASTNDLLHLVRHTTPTQDPDPASSPFNITAFNLKKYSRESRSVKRDEELSVLEKALGKPRFTYQLVPMNRSVETFSSSSESGMLSRTPPVELSRNNSLKSFRSNSVVLRRTSKNVGSNSGSGGKRDSTSTAITSTPTDSTKRHSNTQSSDSTKRHSNTQSTTSTSIFQDLDDLSCQLTSFIEDPEPEKHEQHRFVHKNVITSDHPLYTFQHSEQANLSNQNILETIKLSDPSNELTIESPTTQPTPKKVNYPQEVNSMKGSISVIDSETSTSYSHTRYQPQSFGHNYNLRSINATAGKVLRRDDSMSTRTGVTFGGVEGRLSPTKQLFEFQQHKDTE